MTKEAQQRNAGEGISKPAYAIDRAQLLDPAIKGDEDANEDEDEAAGRWVAWPRVVKRIDKEREEDKARGHVLSLRPESIPMRTYKT